MTPQCPHPPKVYVSDEFLHHLSRQLFSTRYRYTRDPEYPGWTYRDPDHTKRNDKVLRYDGEDGNWWLYYLTDELTEQNAHVARWMD